MISSLQQHEVFIFGSNANGFHGAGSAGLACRGDAKNTWRKDPWFLEAMKSPPGSPKRVGKWAVYGVARGFQCGKEGKSYAIQTIEFPGKKRSTSLAEIKKQLRELADYAKINPQYNFLMTPIGVGLAGWTNPEMRQIWTEIVNEMPNNVKVPNNLYIDEADPLMT